MVVSINRVIVAGNLTRDPELKVTASNRKYTTMTLAVHDYWRDNGGELSKKTTFINLITWGNLAENCAKFLRKGRCVMVEGRLETDNYTDKNDIKHSITKINCSSVVFLENDSQTKTAIKNSDETIIDNKKNNLTTSSENRVSKKYRNNQNSKDFDVPAIM